MSETGTPTKGERRRYAQRKCRERAAADNIAVDEPAWDRFVRSALRRVARRIDPVVAPSDARLPAEDGDGKEGAARAESARCTGGCRVADDGNGRAGVRREH
jgi:hypothetical protein